MKTESFRLHYKGSLLILIFWVIVFFPLAFVLLFTACTFQIKGTTYEFTYNGSRFWLGFWVLVFFPIAFVLLFVNGLCVNIVRPPQIPS
jgi:hypothetical protein